MVNIFLPDIIDGDFVPQFQLDFIQNTTVPLYNHLVKLFRDVHFIFSGKLVIIFMFRCGVRSLSLFLGTEDFSMWRYFF